VCYSSNEKPNVKIEHEFKKSTTKVQESKFESEEHDITGKQKPRRNKHKKPIWRLSSRESNIQSSPSQPSSNVHHNRHQQTHHHTHHRSFPSKSNRTRRNIPRHARARQGCDRDTAPKRQGRRRQNRRKLCARASGSARTRASGYRDARCTL